MSILKALSDENRIRILMALVEGELCVCQITELLGLAPSTVSKHLSILYGAGLVNTRKSSKWVYYSLPEKKAHKHINEILSWIISSSKDTEVALRDLKKLKKITVISPEEACEK